MFHVSLLAAHCFQNKGHRNKLSSHEIEALLGKHDFTVANEFGSKISLVWEIILHPDWDFNNEKFDADISVVVLVDRVEFSDQVQRVCLPQLDFTEVSGQGTVVGWGKSETSLSHFGDHSSTPIELVIPAINSSHCYTTFYKLAIVSSNRMFCGGFEDQEKAPCLGDSGSGFYHTDGSSWKVRGIVSASIIDYDFGCDVNKFSLYTNVAWFTEWITTVMKETTQVSWKSVEFICVECRR